jgi:hypothetical protein
VVQVAAPNVHNQREEKKMKLRLGLLTLVAIGLAACSDDDSSSNDTTAPTVAISTPTAGTQVSGAVEVTGAASDNDRIVLVEFFAGGSSIGSDTTSPYAVSWSTAGTANGDVQLTARATDASGNTATSAAVTVTVANADALAPTVSLTAPATCPTPLSGLVTLTADASDNVGVRSVTFLVDGTVVGHDNTAPYAYRISTAYVGGGSHEISARATDTSGNTAVSTGLTCTLTAPTVVDVSADVGADTTWTVDNVYHVTTLVYVTGGTLTIEPGTVVAGDFGSALAVTKTGRIAANGTADAPVIFTSSKAFGTRRRGDWGGIVLLGAAPINVAGGTANIEGISASAETSYGGADAAHDCGSLRYVRVEYAGYVFGSNNELNGITLGGCGSDTVLDHVQVHKGLDDGIEFFGGTANLKHAVISDPDDDGLDWDFGWQGKVQFLLVRQEPGAGDKGFESDNNGNANDATPRSRPTIYNATLVGSGKAPGVAPNQQGMHLRRGTAGQLFNFIVTRFSDAALDVDDTATGNQITAGELTLSNSIVHGNGGAAAGAWGPDPDTDAFEEPTLFTGASYSNRLVDPELTSTSLTAPNYAPSATSPALSGAATPPSDGFFDDTATFVGAIRDGASDWTAGWTAFP